MTNAELCLLAQEYGFKRVCVTEAPDGSDKAYVLLIMPYEGGISPAGVREGVISPYYKASNRAHAAAREIAKKLEQLGYSAYADTKTAVKPLLVRSGIGEMGRNSLVGIDGLGSRFHVQLIVTDAPLERVRLSLPVKKLAVRCLECERCVKACPAGAIGENFAIDTDKCLRAVSELTPPPADKRRKLGNRILGCDVCQDVCQINAELARSEALTVSLEALLKGEITELSELIGTNYARKKRMRIKALIACANMGRTELLPLIRELCRDEDKDIAGTAAWACGELEK